MPRKLKVPWLEAYLKYVEDTESPENYKYWSGISALSTTLKRNVYVNRGKYNLYPNQYIILVGPPGIGKGTAMNPAVELVRKANVAHYMEDRITAERATELLAAGFQSNIPNSTGGINMSQHHCATAVAPELSIFLGASEWMLQFLCTLWDKNKFTYDTKKTKAIVIDGLSFGILGACTPDYIRRINRDAMAAVAGGFTSRTIFVFANKKGASNPWPDSPKPNAEDELVEDLQSIAMMKGDFSFEKGAKDLYIDFYSKNDMNVDEFETEVLLNFRSRMCVHVMKHAMCLSVSEREDLIITESMMRQSINEVLEVFKSLDVTFRGVGESDLAEATRKVMDFIERKGICSRSEILRANYRHITDEDLSRVLITLKTIDFCFEGMRGNSVYYTYNKSFNAAQGLANIGGKNGSGNKKP